MEPVTPAEHALLAAASRGEVCDLRTDNERAESTWRPTADDAAGWDEQRVVRAAFLTHLLIDQQFAVRLNGARIAGTLDLSAQTISLCLPGCVLTGDAWFGGATFIWAAMFVGATFTRDAIFVGATFTGDAWFDGATFTQAAVFDAATFTRAAGFAEATFTWAAGFTGATFTEAASFTEATFTMNCKFVGTTFTRAARFAGATFTGDAGFLGATFTGEAQFAGARFTKLAMFAGLTFAMFARFNGATFTGKAQFAEATFTEDAQFGGATFTGDAQFGGATFTGDAQFAGATFTGAAQFDSVRARDLDWSATHWSSRVVTTAGLAVVSLDMTGAVLHVPVRLDVTADEMKASRLRAAQRLHLVVAGAKVNFTDADLPDGSLIEAADTTTTAVIVETPHTQGTWVAIPHVESDDDSSARPPNVAEPVWTRHIAAMTALDNDLTSKLTPGRRATITSLQRAHVGGVTLSGMDLRACTFASVDGLDELVVAGDDVLASNRGRAWFARWRTDRRVIADELACRTPPTSTSDQTEPSPPRPTAREVSTTYRALRKALEDSKDEPGAADFYYGEMEMRRLAAARWSVERTLLTAYWLISGYGLRAWRALATLVMVIAVAGLCFTVDAWAEKSTTAIPTKVDLRTGDIISAAPQPHGLTLARAWLFSAQESVALFRPAGLSGVTLSGFGHIVDLAVRVLGPVLLALAVLAIRNRTKR